MLGNALQTIFQSLPLASQTPPNEASEIANAAIGTDVGLIILGLVLLGCGSFMFLVKLCKSLAAGSNE